MIINQISVFLENKPGTLASLINVLGENNINLEAFSIAETESYGIIRIIVDKPEETYKILSQQGWAHSENEVLAVTVPDVPGSLGKILNVLASNQISLEYSYAFLSRNAGQACIVLRVSDNKQAEKLLKDAKVTV